MTEYRCPGCGKQGPLDAYVLVTAAVEGKEIRCRKCDRELEEVRTREEGSGW